VRVIVTGSRDWDDPRVVREAIVSRLRVLPNRTDTTIVHGAARGVDNIAAFEANMLGFRVEPHPADWDEHDRDGVSGVRCLCRDHAPVCPAAGPRRNEAMARLGADLCLAFPNGPSPGTTDMIRRAGQHGIPVEIIGEFA